MTGALNALWGRAVAEELARCGVNEVCIAPGNRSAPLVLALHDQRDLSITTHFDERSAAYFALGAANVTRRPVAVVTTSGTAAANLLPAIVEAHHARVPIVALTADRPPELRGVGANQAIDQDRLFGSFVRSFLDAGTPEPLPLRVRHLRGLVCRAVAAAMGPPQGPVHVNLPFREPFDAAPNVAPEPALATDRLAVHGRADGQPFVSVAPSLRTPDPGTLQGLAGTIRKTPLGLVVCGPRGHDPDFQERIARFSTLTGYPVLADPLSGVRYGPLGESAILSGYDSFLAHAATRDGLRPDLILRFGAAPTSKTLLLWLAHQQGSQVLFDEGGPVAEEGARIGSAIPGDANEALGALEEHLVGRPATDPDWARAWRRAENATAKAQSAETSQRAFEGGFLARLVARLPGDSLLYVSNSLPIRDLDRFAGNHGKPLRVLANRGASGIDGILSSALGAGHATGRRVTIVIGDLALLHDLNALVQMHRLGIRADVWVINNDGGGIFEFLPVARQEPPFTELFVVPHATDFAQAAQGLHIATQRISLDELRETDLEPPAADAPSRLIEVVSDRKANVRHRREVEARVSEALDAARLGVPHAR